MYRLIQVYISKDFCVFDYCSVYVFSDFINEFFRQKCNYVYIDRCGQCNVFDKFLDDIENVIQRVNYFLIEDRDEVQYFYQYVRDVIYLWKCY